MSQLSEKSQVICERHYDCSCNHCPLQPACHKPIAILTQKSLDEWRERINRLAEAASE